MMQMQEQNQIVPIITPVYCKQKKYLIEDVSPIPEIQSEDSNSSENIPQTGASRIDDDTSMSTKDCQSKDTDVSMSPTCDRTCYTRRKKIIVSTTPPTVSEVIVNRTKTPLAEGTIIFAHEELIK